MSEFSHLGGSPSHGAQTSCGTCTLIDSRRGKAFGLTRVSLGEHVFASYISMGPVALAYTYLGYAGLEQPPDGLAQRTKHCSHWPCLQPSLSCHGWFQRLKGQCYLDANIPKHRLERDEKVALLDVRTDEEFRGELGHIAGATNIPISNK